MMTERLENHIRVINNHLTRKMLDAQTLLLELKEQNQELDVDNIKETIENGSIQKKGDEPEEEKHEQDFFEFAEEMRSDFKKRDKYQRWKNYGTVLNKLRDFRPEVAQIEKILLRFFQVLRILMVV